VAFAFTVLHERLTPAQGIGVGLAIIAAILLSLEPTAPDSKT
jgi:drug/metabolite transporter (DMT)-like permease